MRHKNGNKLVLAFIEIYIIRNDNITNTQVNKSRSQSIPNRQIYFFSVKSNQFTVYIYIHKKKHHK